MKLFIIGLTKHGYGTSEIWVFHTDLLEFEKLSSLMEARYSPGVNKTLDKRILIISG